MEESKYEEGSVIENYQNQTIRTSEQREYAQESRNEESGSGSRMQQEAIEPSSAMMMQD